MYSRYCKLRDSLCLKDADIAHITRITPSTFSDWKKGKSAPNVQKLVAIARVLDTSVEYLVTGEDPSEHHEEHNRKESQKRPSAPVLTDGQILFARFKSLMDSHGESFSDVARAIRCRPSTFTDWRAGRYTPKRDKLEAIAKHFGISYYEFIGKDPCPAFKLSTDELIVLDGYRQASSPVRKIIFQAASDALTEHRKKD